MLLFTNKLKIVTEKARDRRCKTKYLTILQETSAEQFNENGTLRKIKFNCLYRDQTYAKTKYVEVIPTSFT